LTIQIALDDPVVDSVRAFELSMRFVADQLGFDWAPGRGRTPTRTPARAVARSGTANQKGTDEG
jgi:hypothetical protein